MNEKFLKLFKRKPTYITWLNRFNVIVGIPMIILFLIAGKFLLLALQFIIVINSIIECFGDTYELEVKLPTTDIQDVYKIGNEYFIGTEDEALLFSHLELYDTPVSKFAQAHRYT